MASALLKAVSPASREATEDFARIVSPPDRGGYTLIATRPDADHLADQAEDFRRQTSAEVVRSQKALQSGSKAGTVSDVAEPVTWKESLTLLLQGLPFQLTMAGLICCNAVVVGLETDFPELPYWKPIENSFLLVFTIELCLRVYTLGLAKYIDHTDEDFVWNTFDFLIVASGVMDFCASLLRGTSGGGGFATIFRVARLMRILRVLRIVRFLRQLYTLAFGFILAAIAICWVSLLMVFILYICSVILVRNVKSTPEADKDTDNYEFLLSKFGSIPQSMLTLFELMVNPYIDPYHDVMRQDKLLMGFVVGFVIFGSFGMIALLSGVISEAMFENNQLKIQEKQNSHDAMRIELLRISELLFDEMETNEDGEAPIQALVELLPRVAVMFKEQGLSFACDDEFEDVCKMMDLDCSGTINKHEFSKFLKIMAEGVRPLLLMEVRNDICHCLVTKLAEFERGITELQARVAGCPGGKPAGTETLTRLTEDLEAAVSKQQVQLDSLMQFMRSSLHETTAQVESRCASACADAARRAVLECMPPPACGGTLRPVSAAELLAQAKLGRERTWPSMLDELSPASGLPTARPEPSVDWATRLVAATAGSPATERSHGGSPPSSPGVAELLANAATLPRASRRSVPPSERAPENRPWYGETAKPLEKEPSCDIAAGPQRSAGALLNGEGCHAASAKVPDAAGEASPEVIFRDAMLCQHD